LIESVVSYLVAAYAAPPTLDAIRAVATASEQMRFMAPPRKWMDAANLGKPRPMLGKAKGMFR
jgi:hypothetical protein